MLLASICLLNQYILIGSCQCGSLHMKNVSDHQLQCIHPRYPTPNPRYPAPNPRYPTAHPRSPTPDPRYRSPNPLSCHAVQVVRVINIILFWPILARTGAGIDLPSAAATAWSGIRGFIGLILALMVSMDADIEDEAYKLLCFFFMATTACLTIIVQGGVFELVVWVSQAEEKAAQHILA